MGAAVVGVGVGVYVNVAVTTMMIGVTVGVGVFVRVGVPVPGVGVLVGVRVAVPVPGVAVPELITTVSKVPNGWDLSLDNFHIPVMVPLADEEVSTTETFADSPGCTIFPMAVAFPPRLSPEIKTSS